MIEAKEKGRKATGDTGFESQLEKACHGIYFYLVEDWKVFSLHFTLFLISVLKKLLKNVGKTQYSTVGECQMSGSGALLGSKQSAPNGHCTSNL